jgi:hypothetical protein
MNFSKILKFIKFGFSNTERRDNTDYEHRVQLGRVGSGLVWSLLTSQSSTVGDRPSTVGVTLCLCAAASNSRNAYCKLLIRPKLLKLGRGRRLTCL